MRYVLEWRSQPSHHYQKWKRSGGHLWSDWLLILPYLFLCLKDDNIACDQKKCRGERGKGGEWKIKWDTCAQHLIRTETTLNAMKIRYMSLSLPIVLGSTARFSFNSKFLLPTVLNSFLVCFQLGFSMKRGMFNNPLRNEMKGFQEVKDSRTKAELPGNLSKWNLLYFCTVLGLVFWASIFIFIFILF